MEFLNEVLRIPCLRFSRFNKPQNPAFTPLPLFNLYTPAPANNPLKWRASRRSSATSLRPNHQPSTINHQPSTNNQQPSTINHQPSTNNQQPTTINHQPSTITPPNPISSTPLHPLNRMVNSKSAQRFWSTVLTPSWPAMARP